ncbi:MAG: glycosyltransferase, partial [Candidatus Korobacteraceae bacterium]
MLKLEQNLSSTIRVTAAEPGIITGTPRLSVVVPVRNGRMSLGRCLDGLAHSDYAEFEVIVV